MTIGFRRARGSATTTDRCGHDDPPSRSQSFGLSVVGLEWTRHPGLARIGLRSYRKVPVRFGSSPNSGQRLLPMCPSRFGAILDWTKGGTMSAKRDAQAHPGDVVVVHGHTTGDPGRTGVILDVLDRASAHEHYRVRWDAGPRVAVLARIGCNGAPRKPPRARRGAAPRLLSHGCRGRRCSRQRVLRA